MRFKVFAIVAGCVLPLVVGYALRANPQPIRSWGPAADYHGPEAQFACPEPDTVFYYDLVSRVTNRPNEFRILGSDGFACAMHSTSWGDYKWIGGITPYWNARDDVSAELARRLWPLRIGNHAEARYNGYEVVFDVVGYDDIETGLGPYKAFVIVKSYKIGNSLTKTVIWWSPRFKWVIKQFQTRIAGKPQAGGVNNWTLDGVSLPSPLETITVPTKAG